LSDNLSAVQQVVFMYLICLQYLLSQIEQLLFRIQCFLFEIMAQLCALKHLKQVGILN